MTRAFPAKTLVQKRGTRQGLTPYGTCFDTVRYFHDAHLAQEVGGKALDKADYVEERALWLAIECARLRGAPRVLLLDEIDKAPKPFPNGLLLELDRMELTVAVPEHMFDQTVSG